MRTTRAIEHDVPTITTERPRPTRRGLLAAGAKLAGGGALALAAAGGPISQRLTTFAQEATPAAGTPAAGAGPVYEQSPWWPYLSAHIDDQDPPDLVGGPITVTGTQQDGPAFWVFPRPRELDPAVFGTPENPIGSEQPAIFLGLPTELREVTAEGVYQTSVPTPFGDSFAALEGASVRMTLVDATALDGATTKDEVDFEATFPAPEGQGEYRVTANQAAPHGWAYPTGGGVVTNVLLHGVSGWGTRLFPTIFTYAAFWGPGNLSKDGQLVAEGLGVHVMLTEFARVQPYDQAFDAQVNPNSRHLHLQIAPFNLKGESAPVPTGFTLPNGMEQPFLHVMFPALQLESGRAPGASATPAAQ